MLHYEQGFRTRQLRLRRRPKRSLLLTLCVLFATALVVNTGSWIPRPVRAQAGFDIEAVALEVTQGVQNLNNTVRLVARKATFVRFHVRTNGEAATVSAVLRVVGAAGTVDLLPINSGGAIVAVPEPNRANPAATFLFAVPTQLTAAGNVGFQALVNPGGAVPEANFANNTFTIPSLTFEQAPTLNLIVYNLAYTVNGVQHIAPDAQPAQMVNWMMRSWPAGDVQFRILRDDIGTGLPSCEQVNRFLATKRALDMQGGTLPPNTRYYGMVTDTGGFMRGCADDLPGYNSSGPTGISGTPNSFPWDRDGTYGDWYGSHEVAHSFGRFHAEFCEASAGMPYPYPNALISPAAAGPSANFGFDILTGDIYPGGVWSDNMAYCNFQWISDFTYHGLLDALINDVRPKFPAQSGSHEARAAEVAAAPQDRLLVQGTIFLPFGSNANTEIALEQPFVIPQSEDVTTHEDGPYAVVLRGASNAELQRYPFEPSEVAEDSEDPDTVPDDANELRPRLSITEMMPVAAPTLALATRLDIEAPGGVVLRSVNAGVNAPAVQFTQPTGGQTFNGEVTARWTASDADGDALSYILQYSDNNGATWETVDAYLNETSVVVDTLDLTGGQQARFRIFASDGIRTSIAISNPFTVPNEPPTAEIQEPSGARTLREGQALALFGEGYDPDDGSLPSSQIKWSSNIAGQLGVGNSLTVAGLAPGAHTITLTADDGAGGVATDTTEVVVRANNASPTMQFDESAYAVNEGDGAASITVFRAGDTSVASAVDYAATPGTASDRTDYTFARGTLLFAPGEVSKTVRVIVTDDGFEEGVESLTLALTNPMGGASVGLPSGVALVIEDNDDADAGVNPIDDSAAFVRQHYADFLNREPDAAGLAFWVNQIESCGANASCREVRRINVSAAFFLSIESQSTGFLVYRFHRLTFGNLPGFDAFTTDSRRLGEGVVVGVGNWEARLEQNKRAFSEEWTNRPAFLARFPLSLTAAQYVDALNAGAGGALTLAERNALVAGLTGGAETRGSVLRKVAENSVFTAQQFGRAFVYTEYAGYLRRNPDDAPDNNLGGYNFWLGKLTQFNGNFVQAEMVKAFISSVEYRARFGRS